MNERPMLFSAPMVRAILDGRKTQTRRVIKPQPIHGVRLCNIEDTNLWSYTFCDLDWKCPYGQVGDVLWVRESYWIPDWHDLKFPTSVETGVGVCVRYVSSEFDPDKEVCPEGGQWKKRPSIHLPKWASRISLEIDDVRVERLHDITDKDCISEGSQIPCSQLPKSCRQGTMTERTQFSRLWDSINLKKQPWWSNPWVWVVEFKKLENQSWNAKT